MRSALPLVVTLLLPATVRAHTIAARSQPPLVVMQIAVVDAESGAKRTEQTA